MEMTPDSLEDFLTKAAGVSAPWCEPTSSLPFSICPSRSDFFFMGKFVFFATNTGGIFDVCDTLTSYLWLSLYRFIINFQSELMFS
jgi:hypothetical protein